MSYSSKNIRKTVLTAMLIALGIVLPFLTGQIKEIDDSLLPMHLVILLCGFICGWKYGLFAGAVLPVLRFALFARPPMPNALWMLIELASYGFISGFLYSRLKKRGAWGIYISLISAMIGGRIVWGVAKSIILGFSGKAFLFSMFIAEGIIDALPGIIIQLVLIPLIVKLSERTDI